MLLRPYQIQALQEVNEAWQAGATNVLLQLATGGGKTVLFCSAIRDEPGASVAIAHRVELVSQISLTLARHKIRHNIVAPLASVREIVRLHMDDLGISYYDPHARRHVAGVDTLINMPLDTPWFSQIKLVVMDEGHHPLRKNKWGRASLLFPNARGLYPTATPTRADGAGLGRHADGIMDAMVIGVSMRELINAGYLTPYRIFCPPSDLDLTQVPVTASGDYSPPKLRNAVHKSHITGDVVAHYKRIASGKLGITFAVDVEAATEIAAEFCANGVAAEVISAKTPNVLRESLMHRFRAGEIKQLVNVDLLGEGVDVPAVEVVSMCRPTQSYGLYAQQFGRALRPLPDKTHAIIIDHVGNVVRHGLPDAPRNWTLDKRERRGRGKPDDGIPLRTCLNVECMGVYPRTLRNCPNCGFYSPPAERSAPEHVDGDLLELDEASLALMRGEIARVDGVARIPHGLDDIARRAVVNRHSNRQHAQGKLRVAIAEWAGYLKAQGCVDSEIYRQFYFKFDTDILTAQTYNTKDAEQLENKIIDSIRNIR